MEELFPLILVIGHDLRIERTVHHPGLILTWNAEQFDQGRPGLKLVRAQQLWCRSLELAGSTGSTSKHRCVHELVARNVDAQLFEHSLLEPCVVCSDCVIAQRFDQRRPRTVVIGDEVEVLIMSSHWPISASDQRREVFIVHVVVQPMHDEIGEAVGLEIEADDVMHLVS